MTAAEVTVLVVDDEEIVLRAVRRTLRAHGFARVLVESRPEQVLARIEEERPGVLLLDLVMPRLGGRELLSRVRNAHPEVVVLVATAEHDEALVDACRQLGAFDYIAKPVSAEHLVATVTRAAEHAASLRPTA